jgi:hypothetical protein
MNKLITTFLITFLLILPLSIHASDANNPQQKLHQNSETSNPDSVQVVEYGYIGTACKRIIFNNAGNIGNGGYDAIAERYGGAHMDFYDDCDTTDNFYGNDDNASIYLKDASPFILRIDEAGDTVLYNSVFNATPSTEMGFRPLEGTTIDTTSFPDYHYASSGKFTTPDSTLILEVEYFAPTHPDTCDFVIQKLRTYMNVDYKIEGLFIGNILDWDIPSDSGVRNGSDYDDSIDKQLIYCYGAEYGADLIENNDCVLADQRGGGVAFYAGYRTPACDPTSISDSIYAPRLMATLLNEQWVFPTGNFISSDFYEMVQNSYAYKIWESDDPDSLYQDLHILEVFGQYDFKEEDTLVFANIIISEYANGFTGLQNTIEKARAWIDVRSDVFEWPDFCYCGCCVLAGDANYNGSVNILDITFLISYLYKSGPAPDCNDSADANGNETINILDITHLINYLYKGGPEPICGETCTKGYK